jgi:dolichol-phosphate mannosyltransferase
MSRFATRLADLVLKSRVTDPMSGFFAINRDALLAAAPHLSSVGYKVLLDLIASSSAPLRVAEVGYTFRDRLHGESKLDSAVLLDYGELLLDKLIGRWIP